MLNNIDRLVCSTKVLFLLVTSVSRFEKNANKLDSILVSNSYCVVFFICFSSSCVLYVTSFSGFSICYCPFGIL
jgi:hypothetical protein